MSAVFFHYPSCSTCKKAKSWLDARGLQVQAVHIVEAPPTRAQLQAWWRLSGQPLKRFFNTSGGSYRALELTSRYDGLSDEERLDLLAADGKLIKRPLLILDEATVLVGFQEALWAQALSER